MIRIFTALALLVMIGCSKDQLAPSGSISIHVSSDSRAQGHESFPMEYLAFNECSNEWVAVSLLLEYKYNYFTNKTDFHAVAHYQIKEGLGTGLEGGNIYKLVGQTVSVEKLKEYAVTKNEAVRIRSKLTFINPGGSDWVTESVRIRRVADDGTITIDTEEQSSFCR